MRYVADFETTTDPEDCRVWAFGIMQIGAPESFMHGQTLDEFMSWCGTPGKKTVYFHNLKFDGEFIMCWLFANGFRHSREQVLQKGEFSTLISDMGQFYSIKVCFDRKKNKPRLVEFLDSLKILPFSVKDIARGFGLPIQKLEIDYHEKREIGHRLTVEEVDYLRNDVEIVASALADLFAQDMTRMTAGANALAHFRRITGHWKFKDKFPVTAYDGDIRQSYRGGFTWLNPRYAEQDIGEGIVLDVNSLYPYVMREKPLPYGEGRAFDGAYKRNRLYNVFIQMFKCNFKLRPDRIPTVQIKGSKYFSPTEYLKDSRGQDVVLCMTNVDLFLFFEQYEVYNIEWIGGWMWKSKAGLFTEYVDYWTEIKTQSKLEGNRAMYVLSKLMLNSLYGKFAASPSGRSKLPIYRDGAIIYRIGELEQRNPVYIPVGTFVTSYAREKTIRAAQASYDRFVYADTDSLHLLGTELPDGLDIDPVRLGAWKHELTFDKARFIRAKTYMEHGTDPDKNDYHWKITCAGMPAACHPNVTFENFHPGAQYPGKLTPWHVPGGIVLVEIPFTIQGYEGVIEDGKEFTLFDL